jgi:hypothetical protein
MMDNYYPLQIYYIAKENRQTLQFMPNSIQYESWTSHPLQTSKLLCCLILYHKVHNCIYYLPYGLASKKNNCRLEKKVHEVRTHSQRRMNWRWLTCADVSWLADEKLMSSDVLRYRRSK